MRSRIGAALVATSFWALALVAPAHATFPGANGKLAYSGGGISVVNPDGSGATQITHNPYRYTSCFDGVCHEIGASDGEPSWSADGRKLAFDREVADPAMQHLIRTDIYSVNADGTGLTLLTTDGHSPAWSPDGHEIAFIRGGRAGDLYVMRADGTQLRPIVAGANTEVEKADWSPDGGTIAFAIQNPAEGHGREFNIHLVNPDGTNDRTLLSSQPGLAFENSAPSWSPDGRRIAFTRRHIPFPCCLEPADVWVMNADGSGLQDLTPNTPDSDEVGATWSPDGSKILFNGNRLMNPDGTNQTTLPPGALGDSWQPLPGPQRNDYKNAAQFCKAERDFLGDAAFAEKYGGGANAYGKCVSAK